MPNIDLAWIGRGEPICACLSRCRLIGMHSNNNFFCLLHAQRNLDGLPFSRAVRCVDCGSLVTQLNANHNLVHIQKRLCQMEKWVKKHQLKLNALGDSITEHVVLTSITQIQMTERSAARLTFAWRAVCRFGVRSLFGSRTGELSDFQITSSSDSRTEWVEPKFVLGDNHRVFFSPSSWSV